MPSEIPAMRTNLPAGGVFAEIGSQLLLPRESRTGSLGPERYILPTLNLLTVIKAKMASSPEKTMYPAKTVNKS